MSTFLSKGIERKAPGDHQRESVIAPVLSVYNFISHLHSLYAENKVVSPLLVASVLSLCTSPCLPARSAGSGTGEVGRRGKPRYRQRTEALAVGKANRRWTAREVLSYLCCRFPLENHSSQMLLRCQIEERAVKVPAEGVGWGLTPE